MVYNLPSLLTLMVFHVLKLVVYFLLLFVNNIQENTCFNNLCKESW